MPNSISVCKKLIACKHSAAATNGYAHRWQRKNISSGSGGRRVNMARAQYNAFYLREGIISIASMEVLRALIAVVKSLAK